MVPYKQPMALPQRRSPRCRTERSLYHGSYCAMHDSDVTVGSNSAVPGVYCPSRRKRSSTQTDMQGAAQTSGYGQGYQGSPAQDSSLPTLPKATKTTVTTTPIAVSMALDMATAIMIWSQGTLCIQGLPLLLVPRCQRLTE